ncbi:MAG: cation-transporting P-type ATPase [Candidatus Bathyarchaeota archaeon]|nr:cation-transporting P-type ATPase [Candidatus Bathyarchaeota archaeon]
MSQAYSKPTQEAVSALGSNAEQGLSMQEAASRLGKYGGNVLVEQQQIRFLGILKEEITEPMILLLIAVGVLYSILGGLQDAAAIIVIIILLVLAEVWNEWRAKRSINALRQLAPPTALVLRDGKAVEAEAAVLVPGDVLLLRVGQRVPADARVLEAFGFEVDESSLTGESLPVSKDANAVLPPDTVVTDQANMVFAGTVVTRGRAKALVTQTGAATELGRISGITQAVKEPKTQLQLAMKHLSMSLVWVALFFAVLIPVLSYIRGLQPSAGEAVLYGLSLAFVVIPEELPIIITMVLGVGSYALSRRGAIVKRLRAAETLGNVTVIATDKTGTLTENKMRVEHLYFDGKIRGAGEFGANENAALRTGLLASDAIHSAADPLGNPMSNAILQRLKEAGADPAAISEGWVLRDELSFDVERKMASYLYQYGGSLVVLSSGAPEHVLDRATRMLLEGAEAPLTPELRVNVAAAMAQMAKAGERLLAFSYHRIPQAADRAMWEQDLVLVGIVSFVDPPRPEVRAAIAACKRAGIRVMMVTGDHPQTAKAIAVQVGIDGGKVLTGAEIASMTDADLKAALKATSIYARVTPEDKLRLVRLLRASGEVVAVTGDGINDAPSLKEAHIGIAMGKRGTDVAKEAADMILTDDNFATIETAISEGRRLYSNLRKGVRYYLACKVALVSIFLVPIALGIPLPFAPIQIIVLELFMDLAASATFVAEPMERGAMQKPPGSPREPFMNRTMMRTLTLGALSLFAAVTATYLFSYYTTLDVTYARSIAFATWMLGHIFLALNFRSETQPLIRQGLRSNRVMLLWALLAVAVLAVATTLPPIQTALQITALEPTGWLLVFAAAFTSTFWMEIAKLLRGKL